MLLRARRLLRLLLLVTAATGLSPALAHAQREKLPPEDLAIVEQKWPGAKKTATGLRYLVLTPGSGEKARPGDLVKVHYTGWLIDGTAFDQNHDPENPFAFRVDRGQVIPGWDEALQRMQRGEKTIFILPHDIAYGSRGQPPRIPRQATLVFEIELLDIERPQPITPSLAPKKEEPAGEKKS